MKAHFALNALDGLEIANEQVTLHLDWLDNLEKEENNIFSKVIDENVHPSQC